MPKLPLEVLYEDNHLLVVNKPAGLATQGVAEGTASVVTRAKEYLKQKYKKPGKVYLGVVSRLDSTVSGVLVLARTSKAADRLTKQFQSGQVEKVYWALVERGPERAEGELSHWVLKNDRERRMEVVQPRTRGAQQARLSYRTLGEEKLGTLVEVRLHTGRKHQIRLQLATIHCPVVGDRKYGSRKAFVAEAIALHCVRLAIEHPTTKERVEVRSLPPGSWGLKKQPAGDK
jgi:23S rRNA pseudouridine1911/1915/1917 synthase